MSSATAANLRRFWSSLRMGMTSGSTALRVSISPVGCLMRSVWGSFPGVSHFRRQPRLYPAAAIGRIALACAAILDVLENNRWYRNESPYGEPQLGRRGLYRSTGGEACEEQILARLWVLNLSDGKHSLLDIAERSGIVFDDQ